MKIVMQDMFGYEYVFTAKHDHSIDTVEVCLQSYVKGLKENGCSEKGLMIPADQFISGMKVFLKEIADGESE